MKPVLFAAALVAFSACTPEPEATAEQKAGVTRTAAVDGTGVRRVVSVYDGDTISVRGDGSIRLLGFDAPEIGSGARCAREDAMARQARDWVAARLRNGVVLRRVTDDRGRAQQNRDRYGRLLRAAYAADGGDIAAELVGQGLAVPYWGRGKRQDWCAAGSRR